MGNHACHKVKLYLTFNFITLVLYLTIKKLKIISPILIYVTVISNNKKYELKLLWKTYQTTRERASLGWKRVKITYRKEGRRKLLKSVCRKWRSEQMACIFTL